MRLSLLSVVFRTRTQLLDSFCQLSSPDFLSNNLSAFRHPGFVVHAISELLDNGCTTEYSEPSFCVNPLTFAESKMLRLVIDPRHNYCHLVRFMFKYEDRSLAFTGFSRLRALVLYLGPEIWISPCWYFSGPPKVPRFNLAL